ncbi:MAG: YhbY family RNA-binding protein [Proteobacteria bacterium]|nr:YhbY family RNA-binding protein [Pseudomonadota bacterium]HQR02936.1 YhbY family RNA-binding protein [Rhodocyclaceae bacterium]
MIELTIDQRKALRAAAHHLKPVASLGQHGLTAAVLKEVDTALKAHELIKVKLHGIERDEREALLSEICTALKCAPVQHIGNILILWREKPAPEAKTVKPASRRTGKPLNKKQAAAASERRRRVPSTR